MGYAVRQLQRRHLLRYGCGIARCPPEPALLPYPVLGISLRGKAKPMTRPRPSYQDGSSSEPNSNPPRVTHPAQGIGLPLIVGLTLAVALTTLSADRIPPALSFLALFLLAISVTTFGVYLVSFVMLRHAQWLGQRSNGVSELGGGTDT